MENPEMVTHGDGLTVIEPLISDDDSNDSNEMTTYIKLPEEVDSFMEDLNSRLTVSRMVSDSVVKGIVDAVLVEAAEKEASNQAEITSLVKQLQSYETSRAEVNSSDMSAVHLETSTKKVETKSCKCALDENAECNFHKHSSKLKIEAQHHVKRLKEEIKNLKSMLSHDNAQHYVMGMDFCTSHHGNTFDMLNVVDECADALSLILVETYQLIDDACSAKSLIQVQQSENKPQREGTTITVQNMIKEIQDDLDVKICEQQDLINTFNQSWQKTVKELSTLRQELDSISGSLVKTESGLVISHRSLENMEDGNSSKRKDHFPWKGLGNHHLAQASLSDETCNTMMEELGDSPKPASSDSPLLKCMTKEEVITHYKTEMTEMKRQHDLALQEKTEELFSLKSEFRREKGSNPLTSRREKDYDLRKKIMDFISRLDNILSENGELSIVKTQETLLQHLKQHFDSLHVQSLFGLQEREATHSSLQGSDLDNQTSVESESQKNLLICNNELELYESGKIEATICDEIEKIVLSGLFGEFTLDVEGFKMACKIIEYICFLLCREHMEDVLSSMNTSMENHHKETESIRKTLLEKEKALFFISEENKNLKQENESLFKLVEEKEKLLCKNEINLMQQKENNGLLCSEINLLQDQFSRQVLQISETKRESDLVKGELDMALQEVQEYDAELSEMNHKLNMMSNALAEAEKQVNVLHGFIEEKQMKLASTVAKEEDHAKHMHSIICSMTQFSEAILQFQCNLSSSLANNESRLNVLDQSHRKLVQQAYFLKKSMFWYKQLFEQRCADLQKAENEVDLLGDEVDALLRLLEKIYIVLEHYSPVLQHYPGVVEILKLIRREMRKDTK